MSLADILQADMKAALRAGDRARLGAIRLAVAAVKQREVDTRATLDDAAVIAVIEKLIKQGRDSLAHFQQAGRADLVAKETAEIDVLASYLPEAFNEDEVDALIAGAIAETGASGIKDMGKVMGIVKARAQGRVDMGAVSARVKAALGAG